MHIVCTPAPHLCGMKDKIEQIKQNQEKMAELLDLYRKAVENEGKSYHLFEDREVNQSLYYSEEHKYYLVKRETKEVVCYGSKEILKSYLRIRQISDVDVMNDVKWV